MDKLLSATAIDRRVMLGAVLGSLAGFAKAADEPFPSMPVHIVVPFSAGGPTDIAARLIAQKLSENLGQPVVVDNRPGAGGTTGSAEVALRPGDGYTLLYGSTSTLATSPALYPKLSYDPAIAFAPIAMVARGPQVVVVNASLPIANLRQFMEYGRANPGKLNYATGGIGSVGHLTCELMLNKLDVVAVHVPFKSGALAVNSVISGDTQFAVDAVGTTEQHVKSGRLKAIAVLRDKRTDFAPDVPTPIELGLPSIVADFWSGVVAPASIPKPVADRLSNAMAAILRQPDVVAKLRALGTDSGTGTASDFGSVIAESRRTWTEVVKRAGIKLE